MRIFLIALMAVLVTTFSWADTFSQQAVSYHKKAEEALKRGDADQAITYYQKITVLDNDDALAHNILGVLYEGKNQLERAEAEYLSALKLEPKYLDAHANLARLSERTGQNEKAAEHLEKLISLVKPKDKRLDEAKTKIIELVPPQERKSNLVKGIEKEQANKLAREIIQNKRLTEKENKKKCRDCLSQGKKYYRQKNYPLALEEFKAALAYEQSNQEAARYVKRCQKQIDKTNIKSQGDEKKKKK